MRAKYDSAGALSAIEQEMRAMVAGCAQPYAAGRKIWAIAFTHAKDYPESMWGLWLVWGALTDWVTMKPHEKERAEQEMLRASREWLALDLSDPKSRDAYLHRWVDDELGIGRNQPS
jgi:hypothetical protein